MPTVMREESKGPRKVPWWGYAVFAALLAYFVLLALWCLANLKLMLGWPLETPSDWYAAIVFAVFGGLLVWYVLAIGWRVIRKRW